MKSWQTPEPVCWLMFNEPLLLDVPLNRACTTTDNNAAQSRRVGIKSRMILMASHQNSIPPNCQSKTGSGKEPFRCGIRKWGARPSRLPFSASRRKPFNQLICPTMVRARRPNLHAGRARSPQSSIPKRRPEKSRSSAEFGNGERDRPGCRFRRRAENPSTN